MTPEKHYAARQLAEKASLRKRATLRRDELHSATSGAVVEVARLFFGTWSPAPGTVVSAFWPIRSELDLRPLIYGLHERDCVVVLPIVVARRTALRFRAWTPGLALEKDGFGVLVPPRHAPELEPDWLLVPLLAFDADGYRLGYGGGFYDISLTALRSRKTVFAIGVAYDGQQVGRVPRNLGDARLDAILTEKRALMMEP
ncbi:MAG: 5-formyltetrahydrofolate cyclo-ligase [Alphaproteobacteria bacterium]|nr:5-formyltetrahydrofolate cyclo-ligase [Alphaproteobacteria bacterium]